jgi:hypothetical protein
MKREIGFDISSPSGLHGLKKYFRLKEIKPKLGNLDRYGNKGF